MLFDPALFAVVWWSLAGLAMLVAAVVSLLTAHAAFVVVRASAPRLRSWLGSLVFARRQSPTGQNPNTTSVDLAMQDQPYPGSPPNFRP